MGNVGGYNGRYTINKMAAASNSQCLIKPSDPSGQWAHYSTKWISLRCAFKKANTFLMQASQILYNFNTFCLLPFSRYLYGIVCHRLYFVHHMTHTTTNRVETMLQRGKAKVMVHQITK